MAAPNLFQELKDALQTFKDFMDAEGPTIQPAVQALRSIIPQITELLDKLIDLMNKLKTEINNLNVSAIPGLDKVSTFTTSIKSLLQTAENLLPDEKSTIDEVIAVADVVTGLPSVEQLKGEITSLIDAIIGHLNTLKS